ncbi:hypothetical protein EDD11_008038 [Mortierella claussenii]|nr:hypothetical protein EDD11_008038 [Mortierella claussenii]
MFKSVADRLGFPHSSHHHHSSHLINGQHHSNPRPSGPSSPTHSAASTTASGSSTSHSSHGHQPRTTSRAPSRQQQNAPLPATTLQSSSKYSSPSHSTSTLATASAAAAAAATGQHYLPTLRPTHPTGRSKTPTPTSRSKTPTDPRTFPPPPTSRTLSPTPKPVLPPLSFHNTRDDTLAISVASAGGAYVNDGEDGSSLTSMSRAAENITVTVRMRPFSITELRVADGPMEVWAVQDVEQKSGGGGRIRYSDEYSMRERRTAVDYGYDHALSGSDNELIYNRSVKHLVQSAMEGYNGTVFAYGQTSSGKTYTMSGTEKQPGITPRAVEDVFKYIRENSEREFLLRVSYLEIYNESIRDLLSPEAIDLRIHEDRKRGVYVSPLKEEIVTTPSQVMRIIQRGDYQRHTSSTDYNAHSSRSHSIFQIVIESRERAPTAPLSPIVGTGTRRMSFGLKSPSAVRVSQLNLIDLAGSEKASSDMERRKEGAFINKSLLTLGTVISKLTEDRGSHIPYRDSKLTRILQSSLSGNARVSVICTISPSFLNVEESHNTLKFAARVKKVITKAHTNQVMDDKALLEKYRREISELKAQLLLTTGHGDPLLMSRGGPMGGAAGGVDKEKHAELSYLLEKERIRHEEEILEMNLVRNALKERIEHLTKLILTSQSIDARAGQSNNSKGNGFGGQVGMAPIGRYTVETSADGSVMEFPKEIESRLTRKDTVIRQLQSELEAQREKDKMWKNALQRTAKGEVVDVEKILAELEMDPMRSRDRFLIEKRASVRNLNGMMWQNGGSNGLTRRFSKKVESSVTAGSDNESRNRSVEQGGAKDDNDAASVLLLEDEHLAIDDEEEDEYLMDTPWNRNELVSLRQAKRELEIVVIEQEKKLEEMVAFEDSEEFRSLMLEMKEQCEKILMMEEEREGFKTTITELRKRVHELELGSNRGES